MLLIVSQKSDQSCHQNDTSGFFFGGGGRGGGGGVILCFVFFGLVELLFLTSKGSIWATSFLLSSLLHKISAVMLQSVVFRKFH